MTNAKALGPTLTMAQLYEQQNQLFDALAVLESIDPAQIDPEIRDRIDNLLNRIMKQKNYNYDSQTQRIFSREELEQFRFVPGNDYQAYEESLRALEASHAEDYPDEIAIEEEEPELPEETFEEPEDIPEYPTAPEPIPIPSSAPYFSPEEIAASVPEEELVPDYTTPSAIPAQKVADGWATLTVGELATRLLRLGNPQKPLTELTIADLLDLLKHD